MNVYSIVFVHTFMYNYLCTDIHVSIYNCTHIYVYTNVHLHTRICMFTYT